MRDQTALKEFSKTVKGTSYYINAREIDNNGICIRPLCWSYNEKPIDILTHLEGWVTEIGKDKKSHNVAKRFELGEEIPEDLKWAKGEFKGKTTVNTPRSAIAFLCFDERNKVIKLASFTQATIIRPIINMMIAENEDGSPNDSYVEDMSSVALIITRGSDDKYSVQVKPKCADAPSEEAMELLKGVTFSFEAYMMGEDPFSEENGITYDKVLSYSGKKPTAKAKEDKPKEKVKDKTDKEEYPDWKKVQTPKGTLLGDCTIDELGSFKKVLETKGKTDGVLYKNIAYGIEHFEQSPAESEDEGVGF